jgi:prolyl-tRNA editing enzyme YbaK/EbsC (Cys-tRNA(Pro) deacylase)
VSLKGFNEVVPAAGSVNSAVRLTVDRMVELADATWVEVSQSPPPTTN